MLDLLRHSLEMPALALRVVGKDPALVVHHAPERVTPDHPEIADYGHKDILDAFFVKRTRHMMMIDHIIALVRPDHDRDHVLADRLALLLLVLLGKAFALLLDLA